MPRSIEQMCRELLRQAIEDKIISGCDYWGDPIDPEHMSSGDLVGMANLLNQFFKEKLDRVLDDQVDDLLDSPSYD